MLMRIEVCVYIQILLFWDDEQIYNSNVPVNIITRKVSWTYMYPEFHKFPLIKEPWLDCKYTYVDQICLIVTIPEILNPSKIPVWCIIIQYNGTPSIAHLRLTRYWPLARCVKLLVADAPGMPGTFSTPPRVSDPDMLTSGFHLSR